MGGLEPVAIAESRYIVGQALRQSPMFTHQLTMAVFVVIFLRADMGQSAHGRVSQIINKPKDLVGGSYLLDFEVLATNGVPNIGSSVCRYYAQAAAVAFQRAGHAPGVRLRITGYRVTDYPVFWGDLSDDVIADWPDIRETVENGACAVAILLVPLILPYREVRRSYQGTGFDFWMSDEPTLGFQGKAGLEVSGMEQGAAARRRQRLNEKLKQAKSRAADSMPTYAIVVEFATPVAECAENG